MKDYRNQAITLLAPLVVNRKGVYTDLAKWARGKGTRSCAWMAGCCRCCPSRASTGQGAQH